MKKLIGLLLAFAIGYAVANSAQASMQCGIPPIPPIGCTPVCQCDSDGCDWVYICG